MRQVAAEVARRQLGHRDVGSGEQQQEKRDAGGQRLDGPQPGERGPDDQVDLKRDEDDKTG
ncbi:hypothetical protein [Microlunatus ginsengisoli]|uniref:hypothetical protein n=1 Tax=Microlunatus ginsengisoli TaxID=363863 RepID=UPI0031E3882E